MSSHVPDLASQPVPGADWIDRAGHRAWLAAELDRLLGFGARLAAPGGGAAWLDDHGAPDPAQGVHTWITARTVHVYALAATAGRAGAAPIARAALEGLTGPLRDGTHGGWFTALDASGEPLADAGKSCYDHAFVVLAASTATVAGLPGAAGLLTEALAVLERRFWDEDAGRCVDSWDRTWRELSEYRGVNGNMHAVEAMLAAADVTGDAVWRERAGRICAAVVADAAAHDWRIPEHYDSAWTPLPEFNADSPGDKFKPYGATVGHGLEWARLLLHLEAAGGAGVPAGLAESATALFDRAVTDGWSVDGAPGFVYTTGWDGVPVVHDRMHWVVAEAIAAAAALYRRTGQARYTDLYRQWWDYAAVHLVDADRGSWHHQLDRHNTPVATVWPGKADLYHAVQATLIPRLPLAPSLATAVARNLLT